MGNIEVSDLDLVDIPSWDVGHRMAAICCAINLLIFTPIMSFYAYKYSKRRNHTKYIRFYQTRNVNLVKFWFLINFYYICVHVLLLTVIQFHFRGSNFEYYFSDFAIISFIFLIFVLRMWKLYFDYMWSMSQLDLIWKRQINQQYSNWYLKHKRNIGSSKFCFFRILLPFYILLNVTLYLIQGVVEIEFEPQIWYAASFATVCILIIFICILNIKLQRCHFADNYGIQEEMSRCAHIIILLFIVATGLYFVFDTDDIRKWMITIIMSIGCILVTVMSSGGVIHIQDRRDTLYKKVQRKFSRNYNVRSGKHISPNTDNHSEIKSFLEEEFCNDPHREALDDFEDDHDIDIQTKDNRVIYENKENKANKANSSIIGGGLTSSNSRDKSIKDRSKRSISKSILDAAGSGRLELAQVITNPKLLNVFAQFLCVEFNVENLLYIIEIVQFKRYIRENQNDCSSILGEYLSIPEHEDLPKFDRLFDTEIETETEDNIHTNHEKQEIEIHEYKLSQSVDVYMYAIYIINKYISVDGTHEINIPGRVKQKIIKQAKDINTIRQLNMEELQVLFDDAFVEILSLLQDPLSRFSSWEEFTFYLKSIGPTAYPFFPKCRDCCKCCCCHHHDYSKMEPNDQFKAQLV